MFAIWHFHSIWRFCYRPKKYSSFFYFFLEKMYFFSHFVGTTVAIAIHLLLICKYSRSSSLWYTPPPYKAIALAMSIHTINKMMAKHSCCTFSIFKPFATETYPLNANMLRHSAKPLNQNR